jgi:hypothetical protein
MPSTNAMDHFFFTREIHLPKYKKSDLLYRRSAKSPLPQP